MLTTSPFAGRHCKFLLCFLPFLLPAFSLLAQTGSDPEGAESLRSVVQSFYDWYVPRIASTHAPSVSALILRYKKIKFNPQLVHALQADEAAQAKSNDIVGLEADSFLDAQAPWDHYSAGQITLKDGHYWVDIHGVEAGKKHDMPDVTAELLKADDHWLFINVHSQRGSDLLTTLKLLRANRQPGKSSSAFARKQRAGRK